MEVIYVNVLIWVISTATMLVWVKKTKDKSFQRCLLIGTACSSIYFLFKKILLPLLMLFMKG